MRILHPATRNKRPTKVSAPTLKDLETAGSGKYRACRGNSTRIERRRSAFDEVSAISWPSGNSAQPRWDGACADSDT